MVLQESYSTTYALSSFTIAPTFTMKCGTAGYSARSITYVDNGVQKLGVPSSGIDWMTVFTFTASASLIKISDWSKLSNNSFYNITIYMNVGELYQSTSQFILIDNFMLVIGQVNVSSQVTKFSIDFDSPLRR
jgi:hypothetical protein